MDTRRVTASRIPSPPIAGPTKKNESRQIAQLFQHEEQAVRLDLDEQRKTLRRGIHQAHGHGRELNVVCAQQDRGRNQVKGQSNLTEDLPSIFDAELDRRGQPDIREHWQHGRQHL